MHSTSIHTLHWVCVSAAWYFIVVTEDRKTKLWRTPEIMTHVIFTLYCTMWPGLPGWSPCFVAFLHNNACITKDEFTNTHDAYTHTHTHTHKHCPTIPSEIFTICLPCTFQTLKYFSKCMSVFVLSLANLLCETGSCGGRLALSDEKVAEPSFLAVLLPPQNAPFYFFFYITAASAHIPSIAPLYWPTHYHPSPVLSSPSLPRPLPLFWWFEQKKNSFYNYSFTTVDMC